MINVVVVKKEGEVKLISVDGHADFAEVGSDIVCAGVSAVVIGIINSIDILDDDVVFDVSVNEDEKGHITYRSLETTESEQLLLNSMLISLQAIEENYSDFIKIKTREVK
ncbi:MULTISPECIES: ribosomal-processing cysteine protease Prp [unclassified Gemella]|uniref:ribosomal-processing cysteine protease Prp n=1 Tax=unclassified Gemella TaxID=2624949 RepID=UPI001073E446|nr:MULTISPECIES: ribosomal-processing cysteine protease Prp [unclassified Gemella]MBF0709994.1 ribosomal-processing cysteine protease Prp [Gemella sp. GL1.1]MBF0746257.1 ribosomal-processing cysteine protease Prp [Gemella sp. 19428wG2_WT2a]NYS27338.1 ribosomal-processing cysteine protease Prp [Gemella sp. GL1]TFU60536.1 ribosomal-processing cysteine protease Prp [Gemella sp. WT2a]